MVGELRLLTRAWCVAREMTGRTPSTVLIDRLLDERSATMVLSTTVAGEVLSVLGEIRLILEEIRTLIQDTRKG